MEVEDVGVCTELQPGLRRTEDGCGLDRAAGGPALITLDDISTLDWIGFPLLEFGCFLGALRAACLKVCATKATRYTAGPTTLLGEGDPAPHCNS